MRSVPIVGISISLLVTATLAGACANDSSTVPSIPSPAPNNTAVPSTPIPVVVDESPTSTQIPEIRSTATPVTRAPQPDEPTSLPTQPPPPTDQEIDPVFDIEDYHPDDFGPDSPFDPEDDSPRADFPRPPDFSNLFPSPIPFSAPEVAEYERYVLPDDLVGAMSSDEWQPTTEVNAEFIAGHVVMDYVSTAYLKKYLASTIDAMNDTGSDWVFYDQYATYYSVVPPEISLIESEWEYGFRSLTANEIAAVADTVHTSGSKFGLMLELNYDGMLTDRANPFSDSSLSQAESAELYINQQADLQDQQNADAALFWDQWFAQYSAFVTSHAELAESLGIEMLVIGKQLGAPTRSANAQRWRKLIAQVRSVYSGKISYAQWVNETQGSFFEFPFDAVDYAIIYNWGELSTNATPTIDDIESSIRQTNNAVYKPLSNDIGTPIIFMAPFQSRSNGAQQEWFEPTIAQPNIGLDLLTQATMYQALFRATANEPWVAGIVSWGFWWRDDFNSIFAQNDASFDKSSSVRNKPTVEVWRRWLTR